MAKFKGKNSINKTNILTSERVKYSSQALPEKKQIKSLTFAENVLYGRVDTNLNSVIPNKETLMPINSRSSASPIIVQDFVGDAFKKMNEIFLTALDAGNIRQNDPYLSILNPTRGWENPKIMYQNYLDTLFSAFNEIFIKDKTRKLTNPEIYVKEFLSYVKKMSPRFPVTYTAWQRSRNSSIFTSGLAIDLAGLPIDDDSEKEAFINSENFDFYLNVCINTGFSVVKNSPWVIVADLGSPSLLIYQENYNLSSIFQTFSRNFLSTAGFDIDYIKQYLLDSYNVLAYNRPYEKNINICNNNNKLIINNINRDNINNIQFNNIFNNSFWIDYYNKIRNIEENNVFSTSDERKFSQNAKNLQKRFDTIRAIGYINEQYRSVYKSKSGGLNYFIRRQAARNGKKISPNSKTTSSSGGTNNGGY